MLCQFSFKNYKSFKDEAILDFQAAAIPEFGETLLQSEKSGDILPVSVIYGPNGGGKSTVLQALSCLIGAVVMPIYKLKTNRIENIIIMGVDCIPFLLDAESRKEPTEFLIYFRTAANEFRYYFALLDGEVVSESLSRKKLGSKKSARIFDREAGEVTLGASINKKSINTNVNAKMPYFSFLAINYDLPDITEAQKWFESCIIRSYAVQNVENMLLLPHNDKSSNQLVRFMNDMGITMDGLRLDNEEKELYIQRKIDGEIFELSFSLESDGTKKLLAVLPVVLLALKEGRLLIVDELDAKLHPKLLRYVIMLFKNPDVNTKGAQLLFTSHDMSTMKNTVFRRDEIWFAAADDKGRSEIFSLHEVRRSDNERVNNTATYYKQYLEGRYGADPYLQNMLTGDEWK